MSGVADKLSWVKNRIHAAADKCGRDPAGVRLIAVSKTKSAGMVKEAYDAGQRVFGESYVQEFRQKAGELAGLDIEWHFVGHLQRNKVKYIVPIVKCMHSLDSIRLVEEIERRAETKIDCLIEVNLAGEASKTGISGCDAEEFVKQTSKMKKINLIGLMTMPPYDEDPEKSRPYFMGLKDLLDDINKKEIYPQKLTELSMGMTEDLEVAIEEGATFVRVGTAIFGERGNAMFDV